MGDQRCAQRPATQLPIPIPPMNAPSTTLTAVGVVPIARRSSRVQMISNRSETAPVRRNATNSSRPMRTGRGVVTEFDMCLLAFALFGTRRREL